jgi:hypothetical protein
LANEISHQLGNAQKRPALREQELKMQYLLIVFTDSNGRFLHGATSHAISESKNRNAQISRRGRICAEGREEREMAIWKIIREENIMEKIKQKDLTVGIAIFDRDAKLSTYPQFNQ